MHVAILTKRAQQALVTGQMRHNSQLNLRIVRGHDAIAFRRDKRRADLASLFRTHGNVLQVRVAARQTPGRGDGLMVRGMHATRGFTDHARKLVGVGGFELCQTAVLQYQARQLQIMDLGQFFEHVLRR